MSRFPAYRPRRMRRRDALRRLVRETHVVADQLVQPLFVVPGTNVENPVPSMPGIAQLSVDRTAEECRRLVDAGVSSVLLFGIPETKDAQGPGGWTTRGGWRVGCLTGSACPTSNSPAGFSFPPDLLGLVARWRAL